MNALEYWKKKCELMEAIEEKNPCDPDITEGQCKAWNDYREFIKINGKQL